MSKLTPLFLSLVMSAFVSFGALAADPKPPANVPPEAGTDVGNWGSVPYAEPEQSIANPEHRKAMRLLEDRQIKEQRELEDRQDEERMKLRRKQSTERESLKRTFK
jgi:hypothetical protein